MRVGRRGEVWFKVWVYGFGLRFRKMEWRGEVRFLDRRTGEQEREMKKAGRQWLLTLRLEGMRP